MKRKSVIVYSVFAIIIYVLAITYFVFNLCYEYSNGDSRTKRRFDHTALSIQENVKKINTEYFDAVKIKNQIITSFGSMDDFAYIEFFEDGHTIYSYKTNTLENSESKLLKNYSVTFRVAEKNYYLTANLYKLRPTSIYYYGKISFLVILIVTIITFILIVIMNINFVNQDDNIKNENIEKDSLTEEIPDTTITENKTDSTESSTEENQQAEEENLNPETEETNTKEESETVADNEEETVENTEIYSTEEPELNEIPTEKESETSEESSERVKTDFSETEDNTVNNEIPEGIYSPDSGLCYEPFLITKLNNEINRAIASESDLSLFIINLSDLDKQDERYKQICNYLILQFQYKELLFEYKKDSIAAIRINSTIDEAITFADKIIADIKNILNSDDLSCYIGITSRTVRMVNAERLLIEADEALVHAKEDNDCNIIAFRADAEKFRQANI